MQRDTYLCLYRWQKQMPVLFDSRQEKEMLQYLYLDHYFLSKRFEKSHLSTILLHPRYLIAVYRPPDSIPSAMPKPAPNSPFLKSADGKKWLRHTRTHFNRSATRRLCHLVDYLNLRFRPSSEALCFVNDASFAEISLIKHDSMALT